MTEKKESKESLYFFPMLEKYDMSKIQIEDKGLERYMNLDVRHFFTGGAYANKVFGKSKISIIERLMNHLMKTEMYTGHKTKAYRVVREAFDMIDKKTKSNPLQTFIDALQNAAPKEETTRLRFGRIMVPKSVDVAPQRRLDVALRNICSGAMKASYRSTKSIASALADEIMKASKNDPASFAIAKKNDVERVAKSAR